MKRDAATLDRLVTWVESKLKPVGLDACILGTAILVDVLKAGGVRAEPLSVQTTIWNGPAWRAQQTNCQPFDDRLDVDAATEAPDAFMLALGFPRSRVTTLRPRANAGRWNGHLVAITDTYLLDPTLGQASRPARGLELPAAVLRFNRAFLTDGVALGFDILSGGQRWRVVYVTKRDNRAWRGAPDWYSDARARTTARFIDALRRGVVPGVEL